MYELPPALGTVKDLQRREERAFREDQKWHDHLEDAYEYFLPNRNLFDNEDAGQKKQDRIFDSTAQNAIQAGASKLQESIAPIWSRWAQFGPSDEAIAAIESGQYKVSEQQLRESLEDQAQILFGYINRSNFGTQFYEMALDLLIGTGTLRVDENDDDEDPIVFSSVPQVGIGFEEGPSGKIETHWRRLKIKARDISRQYRGFQGSESIQQKIQKDPDCDIDCHEGLIYEPVAGVFHGVMWIDKEDGASWYENFGESSPWVTGRYYKVAGEVRGRGPALQALADVKTLNKAKEFALKKAAIDLSGMWTATDDGVTNPYNITIAPGVVIPVGSNNSSSPSLMRLDSSSDLNLSLFVIEDLTNSIRTALFNDLRDPNGPVRSATEIAIEARELAKRIGSAFGRLQTEVLIPILKRVHYILVRRGLLKPIRLGSKLVSIKFTSPLARAQDAEDLMAVQQAVEFTLMTAGPERVQMAFKLEDFGTWAAEKTGMPTELVRGEAQKAKVIQAGAQAAQAGLLQQQPAQAVSQ